MLKFRPISYNEGDFRAVKYVGTSAIQEGQICQLVSGGGQNDVWASLHNGTLGATGTNVQTGTILQYAAEQAGRFFPVYREDPDIENVGATISKNDYCIAFYGQEWEVHKSVTESAYTTTWAFNDFVALGSTGKFAKAGGKNATGYKLAMCIGTFNSTWIRMRAL